MKAGFVRASTNHLLQVEIIIKKVFFCSVGRGKWSEINRLTGLNMMTRNWKILVFSAVRGFDGNSKKTTTTE